MALGWTAYDFDLASAAHVAAVTRLQPPVIRWFVSLDRHVFANSPNYNWASTYGAAFTAIKNAGTKLFVQLQMKVPTWSANDAGNTSGAAAWRASLTAGWPSTVGQTNWQTIVSNLNTVLGTAQVDRTWGVWNEPDWRNDWPWNRIAGGNAIAPTTPWTEGRIGTAVGLPNAPFGWSGGWAKMQALRNLYPAWTWTSDGVGTASSAWMAAIGSDTSIDVIDVHVYQGTLLDSALAYVAKVVAPFTAAGRTTLPIVIGEYGDNANGTAYTASWQSRADQFLTTLQSRYPNRVVGVCAHLQGTRSGVTYPPLWQIV